MTYDNLMTCGNIFIIKLLIFQFIKLTYLSVTLGDFNLRARRQLLLTNRLITTIYDLFITMSMLIPVVSERRAVTSKLALPLLVSCTVFLFAACGHSEKSAATVAISAASAPTTVPAATPAELAAKGAQNRLSAPAQPLSAVAELGKKIFYDASLSASGKLSCASCHSPDNAYAPANNLAVQLGGTGMQQQGGRAVPSLKYHEHTPPFSIGPDLKPEADDIEAERQALAANAAVRAPLAIHAKADLAQAAGAPAVVQENVPQGGFDWDGRAQNLTDQAGGPLMAANEMANKDTHSLLDKFKKSPYANDFLQLFGPSVFSSPNIVLGEAYFALARFQTEDRSFHPYDSKYDYYLAQKVALSAQEERGLTLFKDPKKGNCASCHLEKPSRDGVLAPAFTDYQFEALGAPRNKDIVANRNPHYADLGMCGPLRQDAAKMQNYCGFFKTPSLRNTATRQVFFHNGVFKSLDEVMHFYVERETQPEKWYPSAHGKVEKYNDIPASKRSSVDVTDAPFNSKLGDQAALSDEEIKDVIAFLKTLTDGYKLNATVSAKK
ncbi:cytochrome c peroxidase [Solimicrobium silvestre]|uniref:Di-hem cytochrome c peroxidase n=1 Tax=Solimicrobium silvestre TaxID=2099400 RepID=A0A2S9GZX4_9BURK|nr:cytochrome c peroxidase [Solimicrobium silvestre]PRC93248.1 Di-hem cytochrome c peroxidase [Solimicrobium silvestre]